MKQEKAVATAGIKGLWVKPMVRSDMADMVRKVPEDRFWVKNN